MDSITCSATAFQGKSENLVKKYVFNKPQSLGEGIKRVVKYASKGEHSSPYETSLFHLQTFGNGNDAVRTRTYTNGVTFYQNQKGLFVLGENDAGLIFNDLKKRLACSQPVAATLRKTDHLYNTVIKFTNKLNNIKERLYIKDYNGRITKIKSSMTKTDSGYNDITEELSLNQNAMLKQFSD
ncbi:hypothetical protein IKQ21_07425 [bacterium]|nr:hypothetical protein [bacterium]